MKLYNILVIILLIFLALGIYVNSFRNEFVWDDFDLIVNNPLIKDIRNIFLVFKSGLFPEVSNEGNFYRPLQSFSFMLDYSIWKLNLLGYHITNTIIHLLNSIIIYFLVAMISGQRNIALIVSLFFVAHPVHTEAVTYISGRADPLVTLFCLLSLFSFVKYSSNEKRRILYIFSLICFFFALLSKEVALIFPLLIIIYDACFFKKKESFLFRFFKRYFGFLCSLLIYAVIYRIVIGQVTRHSALISSLNVLQRLMTFVYVFISYLRILFVPFNLHMERVIFPLMNIFDIRFLTSSIIIGIIFITASKIIKTSKLALFGSLWFFVNLIPVSNVFIPLNAFIAEHWLYFPCIGFFIILAVVFGGLLQIKALKKITMLFIIGITIFYSISTIKQNLSWENPITFYKYTLKFSPSKKRLHNNLGSVYLEKNLFKEAMDEVKKAIEIDPYYAEAYANLGNIYRRIDRYEEAIEEYRNAISLKNTLISVYNNLANVYIKKNQYLDAINTYKAALEIKPRDYEIWSSLGSAYQKNKDFTKAVEAYNQALRFNPGLFNVHTNLGTIFLIEGKINEAIEEYREALRINPQSWEAYFNLGLAYVKFGNLALTKDAWQKALNINPSLTSAREGLEKLKEAGYQQ